ncbi:MAG TPA: glycerophosphodiester phosphodiesterase family protein [Armatimonadota bacterium]|nr:glycerophosphodiester phosphodiesterase family protein [Armatimonadota bacterium]
MGFQVCAHRGASSSHPENTVAAFAAAAALGVERVEFDVRRTVDGALVIMHDPTVDRTTDGSGAVWELTLSQIRALDAGSHKGTQFIGERVPTLAEALSACPMLCNVHVYPGPDDLEATVDGVVEELLHSGRLESAFVAGDARVVDRVARVEPRLARCLLDWADDAESYPQRSLDRGCLNLQPWRGIVSEELCAVAHSLGQTVHPFYADDEAEMTRQIACGVDGILTNQPALLQRILRSLER